MVLIFYLNPSSIDKNITLITKSNPVQVTVDDDHNFSDNDLISFTDVGGMGSNINTKDDNRKVFKVSTIVSQDTKFNLKDEDGE